MEEVGRLFASAQPRAMIEGHTGGWEAAMSGIVFEQVGVQLLLLARQDFGPNPPDSRQQQPMVT